MSRGEHRFLGLWTSSAYHSSPADIPLLRRKLDAVIEHFGLPAQSHDAKAVVNVIETFPRDELFQTPTAELIPIVRGIVNLYERRRVRLFVRRDSYERFYSCLVYVPRDRYNTEVRERIERIVRTRFGATHVESQVQISDSALARLHLLVHTQPGAPPVDDVAGIEAEIAAAADDLGRPAAAAADRARRGARCGGTGRPLRQTVSGVVSGRRRSRAGPRGHRRPRSPGGEPRRSATQPAPACRRSREPRAPAHPADRRPDSDFRHPARCSRTSGCACSRSTTIR